MDVKVIEMPTLLVLEKLSQAGGRNIKIRN